MKPQSEPYSSEMNPTLAGRLSPGIAAVFFGGLALHSNAAVQVAGSLLVDLNAADYNTVDGQWPQHSTTGIPGNFVKATNATPRLQTIAGAQALVLDGDGDYLTGPSTTNALHGASAKHSVEYWVYQGYIRPEESVFSWSSRGGPNGTFAGFRYGSHPDYGASARWGAPDAGFAAPFLGGPPAGTWHHIAITYDGTLQKIYIDGALNYTETVGVLDAKDTLPLNIGTERNADGTNGATTYQYSGAISKIRVHSDALSDAQVLNNYTFELPGFPGITTAPLPRPPMHRFSFSNPAGPAADGAIVTDSIGGLQAVVRGAGATFTGTELVVPGGASTQAYLDLPNGIISSKQRISIELWSTQVTNKTWSRMMSFGTGTTGEVTTPGGTFNGAENLVLYANVNTAASNRIQRTAGTISNGADSRVSDNSVVLNTQFHYVIVFDPDFSEWRLYRNGYLMETLPETQGPTSINDVNNWLGRSEFGGDQSFNGSFNEFRIYNYTLTEGQIRGNTIAGPDTLATTGTVDTFTWTPTAAGPFAFDNAGGQNNWGTGAGGTFPDAPGVFANLVSNLTADQTVELNTTVTLGALTLGDTDGSNGFNIVPGSGGSLEMNAGSGYNAAITQLAGSTGSRISAPMTLVTDTEIANASASPLFLAGPVSGTAKLSKSGAGPATLIVDNSAFTGGLGVNGGQFLVGNGGTDGKLGSGPITSTDNGILAFNHSDDVTFTQTITGAGQFHQLTAATLTNSGAINSTGSLDVPIGKFINDAAINGPISIRIDGEGLFRGTSVANIANFTAFGYIDGAKITLQDTAQLNITAGGTLNIADVGTGTTVFNMTGGSISAEEIFIGKNAGVNGYLLQSGGTVVDRAGGDDTRIGGFNVASASATGAWVITGGTVNGNSNMQVGSFGTGSMLISGGDVTWSNGYPVIARFQDAAVESNGLMDVKGGSFTQASAGNRLLVGEEGNGVLEVRGTGVVNCVGGLIIGGRDGVAANAPTEWGNGVVNLATGGLITTALIGQDSSLGGTPYGIFNFHGGVLKARQNDTPALPFLTGIDEANIYSQGAIIDTDSFTVNINQGIDAADGDGVATIPVTAGGSGYLAPPVLRFIGDGTGATALAVIDSNGTVTGITVTNPGTGYTTAPVVMVLGQGSGSGFIPGTPTLAVNATTGSLTKTGSGTLYLNGGNSYTGPTLVQQGALGGAGIIAGNVSFSPGAALAARITNTPAPAHDTLTVFGNINLTGANLQLNLTGPLDQPAYVIATYDSLTGNFAATNLPPGWVVDYAYDDGFSTNNIAIVPGAGSPYDAWIAGFFPGVTDPTIVGATADPDKDGQPNSMEFALGGTPNSGASNAKTYHLLADSSADADTTKESVITIAVRTGTPAFTGTPSPSATTAGYTYTVQGSTTLSTFPVTVVPVDPVVTGLPAAPGGYEYRSFSLSGSNGTPAKGFLRVQVSP